MMRLQAQAAGHVGNISDAGSRPRRARALVETTMSLAARIAVLELLPVDGPVVEAGPAGDSRS